MLTAAQIVDQACQSAHTPGMKLQAGAILNMVLNELCRTYDFAQALATAVVTITPSIGQGTGPFPLPADYLRMSGGGPTGVDLYYKVADTQFGMTSYSLAEYDALTKTSGFGGYPSIYATDISVSPPVMFIWEPTGGTYDVQIRYWRLQPDIASPESSSTVPWFPFQGYLLTRVIGELCLLADDSRYAQLLQSAQIMLTRHLKLQNDDEGRARTVALDKRSFGRRWDTLPPSKKYGW